MSYQKQQRQVVKLNQQQSSILDNITDWTEAGKTINWNDKVTGEPKSFYKKYQEKMLDDSTIDAQSVFVNLGLSTYDKVENFSGVWVYTIGVDRIEREKPYRKGTSSGTSYKATGTITTGTKQYDSDGAKKGHEENVKMHQEYMDSHRERMQAWEEYKPMQEEDIFTTKALTEELKNTKTELQNLCRQIQNLLGQPQK